MITLVKESYCDDCPNFEPAVDKLQENNYIFHTYILCESRYVCKGIYEHIKRKIVDDEKKTLGLQDG